MSKTHVTFYPFEFKEEVTNDEEIKEALKQLEDTFKNIANTFERGEQNVDTQTNHKSFAHILDKRSKQSRIK